MGRIVHEITWALHALSRSIGVYTTFQHYKNNGLQQRQAPSPAGEGWGEESKIKYLNPPHPCLLPQGLIYAHILDVGRTSPLRRVG